MKHVAETLKPVAHEFGRKEQLQIVFQVFFVQTRYDFFPYENIKNGRKLFEQEKPFPTPKSW